jgi:hypothetical protein
VVGQKAHLFCINFIITFSQKVLKKKGGLGGPATKSKYQPTLSKVEKVGQRWAKGGLFGPKYRKTRKRAFFCCHIENKRVNMFTS